MLVGARRRGHAPEHLQPDHVAQPPGEQRRRDPELALEVAETPGAQEGGGEDDGWVLAYVLDDATGRSEVIVLEAADFTAPPVARVLLPVRVPIGFHACWMPGSRVSAS